MPRGFKSNQFYIYDTFDMKSFYWTKLLLYGLGKILYNSCLNVFELFMYLPITYYIKQIKDFIWKMLMKGHHYSVMFLIIRLYKIVV